MENVHQGKPVFGYLLLQNREYFTRCEGYFPSLKVPFNSQLRFLLMGA